MKRNLFDRCLITSVFCLISLCGLSSCVHEFPELPRRRGVSLLIKHELPWSLFYFNLPARSTNDVYGTDVGYTLEIYPHGSTENCIERIFFVSEDITLSDFTRVLSMPVGHYDVWIWSDYVDPASGKSLFYNSANFGGITLTEPYRADTYRKDAFQGMVEVNVPNSDEEVVEINAEVTLRRPLTGYAFIANDVSEFIEQETRRLSPESTAPSQIPAFDFRSYTAKVTYTGYLPCRYSMFRNRPVDSMLGVSYTGSIEITESGDALLAFDTVFINGDESSLTMALEIFDGNGELVSSTLGIVIPTKRNRATIVEAPFLTSKAQGGVNIDTSFTDDFNIKL